jgi:hypothetical protein
VKVTYEGNSQVIQLPTTVLASYESLKAFIGEKFNTETGPMMILKNRTELNNETVWELKDHYKNVKDYYEELQIVIGMDTRS